MGTTELTLDLSGHVVVAIRAGECTMRFSCPAEHLERSEALAPVVGLMRDKLVARCEDAEPTTPRVAARGETCPGDLVQPSSDEDDGSSGLDRRGHRPLAPAAVVETLGEQPTAHLRVWACRADILRSAAADTRLLALAEVRLLLCNS